MFNVHYLEKIPGAEPAKFELFVIYKLYQVDTEPKIEKRQFGDLLTAVRHKRKLCRDVFLFNLEYLVRGCERLLFGDLSKHFLPGTPTHREFLDVCQLFIKKYADPETRFIDACRAYNEFKPSFAHIIPIVKTQWSEELQEIKRGLDRTADLFIEEWSFEVRENLVKRPNRETVRA